MNTSRVVPAGLALAMLALTAAAQKDDAEAQVHKTPKAVFEAAEAARKKGDFKGFLDCFTPASHKRMAGDLAYKGLAMKADADQGRAPARFKEKLKPIIKVLQKHGLTEKATKKIMRESFSTDRDKAMRALAGLIKDPAAFAAEFMPAMEKFAGPPPSKEKPTARLTDIKIDGDRAKGTLVVSDGFSRKQPIQFARVSGGWRIVFRLIKVPDRPRDKGAPARE
jgi:hypothetical protein